MQQAPGGDAYPGQPQQQTGGPPPYSNQLQAGYPHSAQHPSTGYQNQPQSHQKPGPDQINTYKQILQSTIQEKNLQNFFPANDSRLDQAAAVAAANIDQVCADWQLPIEMGRDLAKLALFDIMLYIDNSGSMVFDEGGARVNELKIVLTRVVNIVKLFDTDGISIRFMNQTKGAKALDHVKDEESILNYIVQPGIFSGTTPLGTELRKQVVNDIVSDAKANRLKKPVLVITITDGIPNTEPKTALHETITYANNNVSNTVYGAGAVSFQFAQVGEDKEAQQFLEDLDNDPQIGHLIDCTSNYEQESAQMLKLNGEDLTPSMWILKMLVGAIDSSYDFKDERARLKAGRATPLHSQNGNQGPYGHQQNGQQSYYPPPPQPNYGQPGYQNGYDPQRGYAQPPPQQGYNPNYPQSFGQPLTPQQGFSTQGQGNGYPNTSQPQGGYYGEAPPPYRY